MNFDEIMEEMTVWFWPTWRENLPIKAKVTRLIPELSKVVVWSDEYWSEEKAPYELFPSKDSVIEDKIKSLEFKIKILNRELDYVKQLDREE